MRRVHHFVNEVLTPTASCSSHELPCFAVPHELFESLPSRLFLGLDGELVGDGWRVAAPARGLCVIGRVGFVTSHLDLVLLDARRVTLHSQICTHFWLFNEHNTGEGSEVNMCLHQTGVPLVVDGFEAVGDDPVYRAGCEPVDSVAGRRTGVVVRISGKACFSSPDVTLARDESDFSRRYLGPWDHWTTCPHPHKKKKKIGKVHS